MKLPSLQLEAFLAVARNRSFSRAARELGLTQPALSQRVLNLESLLETRLFVRDPAGPRLTEAGERLHGYGRAQAQLEAELLRELGAGRDAPLAGTVRVGGFSSIMWPVVAPALGPLFRENAGVRFELRVRELRELPALLRSGEIDFALVDDEGRGVTSELLGHEEYVLVEAARGRVRAETYLDHDPEDRTTERFIKSAGAGTGAGASKRRVSRVFVDDIHGVLEGARQGWGRAVVPRHLAGPGLRVLARYGSMRSPVYLHTPSRPYSSRLHQAVRAALVERVGAALGAT
jgi:DNA-binding transcriptional LysR family regulator